MRRLLALGLVSLVLGTVSAAQASQVTEGGFVAKVTSYCLSGTTRSGTPVRPGVIAVDPNWIPLGATVLIEGLEGTYLAEDTGGGVRGAHIDLWQGSCHDAINWGVRYREVSWWW